MPSARPTPRATAPSPRLDRAARLFAASACAASAFGPVAGLGPSGCSRPATPPSPPPAPIADRQPAPQRPEPRRSDPACVGPLDAPPLKLRAATGLLRIGALAGLKDPDDLNLVHLRGLAALLAARGADAFVVAGDLGDTEEAQVALLDALATAGRPLLVLPGNREARSDLDAAVGELRRKGRQVTDLSHQRLVDLGDALVVGLPGAFERRQLRAEGACLYVQQDLDALSAWLDKLPLAGPPVLLVAAAPPRGAGASALDVSGGQNLGDPRLLPLLGQRRAEVGIFGQLWESGGRAIDAHGKPVPPGVRSPQLYVNPGAAERSPWPMADGSTSAGQASLLTIQDRQAAFEPLRAPATEERKR